MDQVLMVGARQVPFLRCGRAGGRRVLFHYGTPGTRLLGPRITRVVELLDIDLVVVDRPGYGPCTRRPGRRVVDVVDDVASVADHLGWGRFATCGGSGGGPHALACAAALSDRVERCACVVSPAPYGAEGLDWFDGMPPGNVEEFSLALQGEEACRPLIERLAADAVAAVRAGTIALGPQYQLTDADTAALQARLDDPGYVERTIAAHCEGIDGWIDDCMALTRPWGFDPAEIKLPVSVCSAIDDSLCPSGHGEWLAAHIPDAELRILPHGHILEEDDLQAVFRWLLPLDAP